MAFHLDAGLLQLAEAVAGNQGVGVVVAAHHTADAALHNQVGAGGRLAIVRAGLEVDIERGAAEHLRRQRAQQGVALGVVATVVLVVAFADDAAVLHHHAAHHRVGPHTSQSVGSQLQAAAHIDYVLLVVHICFGVQKYENFSIWRDFSSPAARGGNKAGQIALYP